MNLDEGSNGRKRAIHLYQPPQRVVSLVPSLTESLFDLGLGWSVVGITDFCAHPAEKSGGIPRLGGPKNPRVAEIIALHPDLVLANQEENTRQVIEALEAAGVRVWVSFPRSVRQAVDVLWTVVGIFKDQQAALRLQTLEMGVEWAAAASAENIWNYFCPIWRSERDAQPAWFMTFNQDTYVHDLLQLIGGRNVFAQRGRRYPLAADLGLAEAQEAGERDTRYPRVTISEILAASPQVIILPDEPYTFGEADRRDICELLGDTPAVRGDRVHQVDGSLLTWHGTRLAYALRELPVQLDIA
jgi:iron complex transport system substrate-binding protein